jgi:hypothetical protein
MEFFLPSKKVMHRSVAIFISVFVLLSCRKNNSGNIPTTEPQRFKYSITPSQTNPNINSYNSPHTVYLDTRQPSKNKLFVFFPGTSGFPDVYTRIVEKAASMGYHALGLTYPNGSEIYVASGTNPDNTSFGRCRQEIFDGSDQSLAISVTPDNCIQGRLTKLLEYLSTQHPEQNWGQFLNVGNINWSKCVVAGHSQGGGHAWFISKKVSVARAISFASIDWNTWLGRSADWITEPGSTPSSKLFSINSPKDQIFDYGNVQTQWNDLQLPGSATSIDSVASPYGQSHRLYTRAIPAINLLVPDHNLTCLDPYIPLTPDGKIDPKIEAGWSYLLDVN